MKFETLRNYLLNKRAAFEDRPFGPKALVFKVMGKMFALVPLETKRLHVTLKCDPDLALHLRGMYEAVRPAYYLSKRHWNTVILDGSVPEDHVFEMIDDSYDLVVKGLRKADRARIEDPDRS